RLHQRRLRHVLGVLAMPAELARQAVNVLPVGPHGASAQARLPPVRRPTARAGFARVRLARVVLGTGRAHLADLCTWHGWTCVVMMTEAGTPGDTEEQGGSTWQRSWSAWTAPRARCRPSASPPGRRGCGVRGCTPCSPGST